MHTLLAIVAFFVGSAIAIGARKMANARAIRLRRRHNADYARLITVHLDGLTTTVVNLDHYRRQRQHHRTHLTPYGADSQLESGDDPA